MAKGDQRGPKVAKGDQRGAKGGTKGYKGGQRGQRGAKREGRQLTRRYIYGNIPYTEGIGLIFAATQVEGTV